ncbi:MAG: DegT/DnrJ/EryC1/StrS family aminotransferase [Candidatus Margulisiibacteriota bacterium]|nr:DegT/DnrJ/EryC1/StrS family aminotransferase [Candidatus Margulisiibacteriota bacterium]
MENNKNVPAILGGEPVFDTPIPITKPTMPPISGLKKRYQQVLKSGMITNAENVREFEKNVAEYLGVKNAVATNSCTSGLMLLMKIMGLKGEVILPSFTFHATAHAVVWNGLKPVFVDCEPVTYNIDPEAIKKAITPDTSAIIGVHIFGNPAKVEELQIIAEENDLRLMFDAAHGFGAKRNGKAIGGFGDAESFSLSPTKLLTAGEGGIVATNNDELAASIRVGRNYGDAGNYDCEFSGFNARMSEFNALLGIESLKHLDKNVKKRNRAVRLYKKLLSNLPGIGFQKIDRNDQSSFKDFSILVDQDKFGMSRDKLSDALLKENIVVKKYFYPPVHKQKAFANYQVQNDLKHTISVADNALSLPLFSHISIDDVKKVCSALERIYLNREKIGK